MKTNAQKIALAKLKNLGWKWTDETIQEGKVRCYSNPKMVQIDPLDRGALIVEVDPVGRVKFGEITNFGNPPERKRRPLWDNRG